MMTTITEPIYKSVLNGNFFTPADLAEEQRQLTANGNGTNGHAPASGQADMHLVGGFIRVPVNSDKSESKIWLLKNLDKFTSLSDDELACVAIEISTLTKIPQSWLDGAWSSAVKKAKPKEDAPAEVENKIPLSERIKADYVKLDYAFALNECSHEITVSGTVLDEPLAASIRVAMRDRGYTNVASFEDVYISESGKNRFHPIKDYFSSLDWDGQNHILALSKYLEDAHEPIPGPYDTVRSVSYTWLLRWLIGAVAKIERPGAQNAMLVLAGAQDAGKSTFARWLCSPLTDLHEESSIDPDNKEHVRKLASKFIWEVSELGATTRRADVESLKAFITRMDVTYRVPYAKHPVTVPATASFIGTVNPTMEGFLNDETGSRRFMILELTKLDWAYSTNIDINQVWAQAYHLFNAGEPWRLTESEVAKRKEINKVHEIVDPMEDFFHTYYEINPDNSEDDKWQIDPTNIIEHLRYKNFKDGDRQLSTRMGITLKRLGVDRRRVSIDGSDGCAARPRLYVGIKLKDEHNKPPAEGYERKHFG
jgi:hypothetical protein